MACKVLFEFTPELFVKSDFQTVFVGFCDLRLRVLVPFCRVVFRVCREVAGELWASRSRFILNPTSGAAG